MSCVYPLDAWRSAKCNESGKRGIVFNPRDGFIDQPLQVPCGKCVGCSIDRSKVWAVRMYHEASLHDRNCFVTLTYADPPPLSLSKLHLQLFFKRLRRLYPVRYFACGEYGTITHRPHYHAVIFGQDFLEGAYKINDELHGNPYVDRAWSHGMVSIGSVTMGSCCYVAGYVNKKIGDPDTFNLMSRRPGIGHGWIEKYRQEILANEHAVVGGRVVPIPKKYMEWYEDDFAALKRARANYFSNLSGVDRWKRRTAVRGKEINYKSQVALKSEVF